MFGENYEKKPLLKLRREHQELADELEMTAEEYFDYRQEIDNAELQRKLSELPLVRPELINSINLIDNMENLGYSKDFLSRADADFLFDKVKQWENENSYVEAAEVDDIIYRDELVRTYMATGVKYGFKNVGITIYNVFAFDQSTYSNQTSCLEYIHRMYCYNQRNGEFDDIKRHDLAHLSIVN